MTISISLLPIKTAISFIMANYYQITWQLPDLEDEKSVALCWPSFSWWGNEDITHCCTWKGLQYIVSELFPQINTSITQDAKPQNRWLLVDAHFQNGSVTVSLAALPIKTAISFIMPNYYQTTWQWPDINDAKSLTLCWHSFSWWGNEHFTHCFTWKGL